MASVRNVHKDFTGISWAMMTKAGRKAMKKSTRPLIVIGLAFFCLAGPVCPEQAEQEDSFFRSSLHFTSGGMAYWYKQENGGLERLTGIPYDQLGCKNCHIASCDACHRVDKDGKSAYIVGAARNQEICLQCHKRELSMMKRDQSMNQADVHTAKGMTCMDCHSAREMHGDGTAYLSMKQPGAMDTTCEKCHDPVSRSRSHTVHEGKLDCKACHVRHVLSCTNCHFDTLVNQGKRAARPLADWVYLMNYQGRVTSANMQTFVVGKNRTFLMFAPANSHSIMKAGRPCDACHATETVEALKSGQLTVTRLVEDETVQVKGVIPVVRGADYKFVYFDFQDGQWAPLENPAEPLLHYAGFGEPLSEDQFGKLVEPAGER